MTKKTYEQPEMTVFVADVKQQILAWSITELKAFGLDEDNFVLSEEGEEIKIWDDAW